MTIVAGIGQTRGQGARTAGRQQSKLRFGHFDSPEVLPETIAISSGRIAVRVKGRKRIKTTG